MLRPKPSAQARAQTNLAVVDVTGKDLDVTGKDREQEDTEGNDQPAKKSDVKKGKKKSSYEEITKEEEKVLKELDFYHGYVAREDLSSLLKTEGDFIVRMTEVEIPKSKGETMKQIVLSMIIIGGSDEKGEKKEKEVLPDTIMGGPNAHNMARNVVIRRSGGMYRIESMKSFKNIKELVEYYKTNFGQVNKSRFLLKNPICQQTWEFSHDDFRLSDKDLGSGAYGLVKQASLFILKRKDGPWVDVAIKMARFLNKKGGSEVETHNDMTKQKIKEMMREARMMRTLQHVNIVKLYGVAVQEQPLAIILELIKGGELKKYLRNTRVSTSEKLKMSLGAANGLEYLHRKGFIHMDIAARNCLYTLDRVVKISDFGLSRQCFEYKIKKVLKLPIKWLAPETLSKFHFTPKTDVYSFGILLVEIFWDGAEPWPGKPNGEVKKSVLEGIFPSELPPYTPSRIKKLVMERIMVADPAARAYMTEIRDVLESVVYEPIIEDTGAFLTPSKVERARRRSSLVGKKKEEATKT